MIRGLFGLAGGPDQIRDCLASSQMSNFTPWAKGSFAE